MTEDADAIWSPVLEDPALDGYEGAHGEWNPTVLAWRFGREAGTQEGDPELSGSAINAATATAAEPDEVHSRGR